MTNCDDNSHDNLYQQVSTCMHTDSLHRMWSTVIAFHPLRALEGRNCCIVGKEMGGLRVWVTCLGHPFATWKARAFLSFLTLTVEGFAGECHEDMLELLLVERVPAEREGMVNIDG